MLIFSIHKSFAQSENPRFQYLSTEDGLSQNSVNDIYQDDLGYLWFATQDGLNRYDGYNFIIYRPDKADPWSISDNFITRIIPAEDGNLWVLGRYGLNLFDRSSGRFYKVYLESTGVLSVPSDVFQWNGKWMSIISQKLYALPDSLSKPSDTLITPVNLPDTVLFAATINAELTLVTQGKLVRLNQNAEIVEELKLPLRANSYDRFIEEMGESFLFISNKLYQFNSDSFGLTPIVQLDEESIIQDICVRDDSSFWIGHSTGLTIFKDNNLHQVETSSNEDGSLSYPFVHSVLEDADKNMWVGTANGGLNIVPKGAERFIRISKEHGLSHNQVWCAYEDKEQNLWIGTEMGLNVFKDGKPVERFNFLIEKFTKTRITALTQDDYGRIWIGTSKDGLYRLSSTNDRIEKLPLNGNNKFQQSVSCFQEQGDTMWVGTLGSLNWVDENNMVHHQSEFNDDTYNEIYYVLSLKLIGKELHIGSAAPYHIMNTKDLSIEHYVYSQKNENNGPSFQFATAIEAINGSDIWLSTFGGGLNHFDRNSGTFTYYSEEYGLENEVIADMIHVNNQLWVSHNEGISAFDIDSKKFTNYGLNDGIPFKEFSLNASGKMRDGRVFFGGIQGLVVIDPIDFSSDEFDLKATVTGYQVNYKSQSWKDDLQAGITLNPEDRVISFRFGAIDFIHSKKFTYEFYLEGFDQGWVKSPIAERRATYSNLPSGNYIFKVRVANQNGQWSNQILEIPILVVPPIWQRWWFLSLAFILLLGLMAMASWYFSQLRIKRKLREMETKQRIHKERERISMDLHDHVGAQISFLISNLDRLDLEGKTEKSRLIGLGNYAREAMRELRDTVWAIQDDQLSIEEIANRIKIFGESLFEGSSIAFSVRCSGGLAVDLDPAPSLHLLRILQEALHNIHKHSQATNASVEFTISGDELNVTIRDNGVGFSEESEKEGMHNGLNNMQERASQMDALITILSKEGSGTDIRISMRLNPNTVEDNKRAS